MSAASKAPGRAWTPERRAQNLTLRDARKAPLFAWARMTKVWTPEEAEAHKRRFDRAVEFVREGEERDARHRQEAAEIRAELARHPSVSWWDIAYEDAVAERWHCDGTMLRSRWDSAYRRLCGNLLPRRFLDPRWLKDTLLREGYGNTPPHPDDADLVEVWTKAREIRLAAEAERARPRPRLPGVEPKRTCGTRVKCGVSACRVALSSTSLILLCHEHFARVPFPLVVAVVNEAKIGQTAETASPAWHRAVEEAVAAAEASVARGRSP